MVANPSQAEMMHKNFCQTQTLKKKEKQKKII